MKTIRVIKIIPAHSLFPLVILGAKMADSKITGLLWLLMLKVKFWKIFFYKGPPFMTTS